MAPHTIAGSHPRRDVPPRRDRPRPTWRSIRAPSWVISMAQTTLLHSCRRYLPGECSRRVESDVDDGGLDRFGFPPLGERDPHLPFSHSAWAPVTWLVIAEAEHVVAPTRGDYFSQAADIALAIL